jgi:hypothetical protein
MNHFSAPYRSKKDAAQGFNAKAQTEATFGILLLWVISFLILFPYATAQETPSASSSSKASSTSRPLMTNQPAFVPTPPTPPSAPLHDLARYQLKSGLWQAVQVSNTTSKGMTTKEDQILQTCRLKSDWVQFIVSEDTSFFEDESFGNRCDAAPGPTLSGTDAFGKSSYNRIYMLCVDCWTISRHVDHLYGKHLQITKSLRSENFHQRI